MACTALVGSYSRAHCCVRCVVDMTTSSSSLLIRFRSCNTGGAGYHQTARLPDRAGLKLRLKGSNIHDNHSNLHGQTSLVWLQCRMTRAVQVISRTKLTRVRSPCFNSSERKRALCSFSRMSTLVLTLLTFWPPEPPLRANFMSTSSWEGIRRNASMAVCVNTSLCSINASTCFVQLRDCLRFVIATAMNAAIFCGQAISSGNLHAYARIS